MLIFLICIEVFFVSHCQAIIFSLFSEPHIRIAPVITEVAWKLEGLD